MTENFYERLEQEIGSLKDGGLFKAERIISSPQSAVIDVVGGNRVINLCANNYLGLANHPRVVQAAHESLVEYGYGMSSVRFICGTHAVHKRLEQSLAEFLGAEDCILYSSCFDANGGLFETLFSAEDAIISDALNHASIIDGIRLCKARRYRYRNNDMTDLRSQLKQAADARYRLIATDGVFSMDGTIANLRSICDLADEFKAMVMVDDSHAVGFIGDRGRGSHEYAGVMSRIDILTGTLGKAMGGASGGYTVARKPVVEWLRQRSRPYLFSNTLAPVIAGASLEVLKLLQESDELRERLRENSDYFRDALNHLGFRLIPGEHPIIPVILGDAKLATRFADELLRLGIYVIGFSYPVVPQGQARIRTQMSAALDSQQLNQAVSAFEQVGRKLAVI